MLIISITFRTENQPIRMQTSRKKDQMAKETLHITTRKPKGRKSMRWPKSSKLLKVSEVTTRLRERPMKPLSKWKWSQLLVREINAT